MITTNNRQKKLSMMSQTKHTLQAVLNRWDKEQLVIKLHQQGKTIREIASVAHLSFSVIGLIIRKTDGRDNDREEMKDLKNKLKHTGLIPISYW
jgi:hypothetical protein